MTPLLKEAIDELVASLVYVVSHTEEADALPYRLSVAISRADEARSNVLEAMQQDPTSGSNDG